MKRPVRFGQQKIFFKNALRCHRFAEIWPALDEALETLTRLNKFVASNPARLGLEKRNPIRSRQRYRRRLLDSELEDADLVVLSGAAEPDPLLNLKSKFKLQPILATAGLVELARKNYVGADRAEYWLIRTELVRTTKWQREGVETLHGTPEQRSNRWNSYQTEVDAARQANPKLSLTAARRHVAQKRGVSLTAVRNHTK